MAFFDTTWYTHSGNGSTTGYYAIPQWAAGATIAAGALRRQLAVPAIGSERVFVCIIAGATNATTEPTWVITRGGRTTDNAVTWQECTGAAAVNGDLTNTPSWSTAKSIATAVTLGAIIQRNSGASYQICSVAGNTGASEPAGLSNTAGVTTADGTVTWTSLGPVANFGIWAAPHARLINALAATWGAAGHDFYLADNSAETTTAAAAVGGPGTTAAPCRIFSIDHTAALPALPANLKPGASITSSLAATSAITIGTVLGGSGYYYGITFVASAAFAGAILVVGNQQNQRSVFEACLFQISGGLGTSTINIGGGGNNNSTQIDLIACTFAFSNSAQIVNLGGGFHTWRNTPDPCIPNIVIPATLFHFMGGSPCTMLIEGVDLNALGFGTLVTNLASGGALTVKNCRIPVAMAFAPAAANSIYNVDVVACDSATAAYRNERHNQGGDLITSATVVRTGGATDGATPVSHVIIPSSFTRTWRPFASLPLIIWNDIVGANRNVTLYGATGNGISANNLIWFDVEYMGSSGSPLGVMGTTGLATQLSSTAFIMVADGSAWDSAAPLRQNSFTYAVGATFRVASNPGRVFYVYSGGASAASEPAGYATAADSDAVVDGTAQALALYRFSLTLALTAPQPLQRGYLFIYPKFTALAGNAPTYLDPLPVLS